MSKRNRAARRAEAARVSAQPAKTAAYEYRQLMSNMLFTDTSYQRPVDASRVDQIVENFDPRVANTLKVSSRDGRFYVFDGAHTLMALKKLHGDAPFPVECKVFFGLSYEDEANLFAQQNGLTKDVPFGVRLRAMQASKSPEAEAFRAHTENAGLTLLEKKGGATKNTIAAVAKAYKLYKDLGPEEYEQVLKLIVDTWEGAAWSLTSYILGGVSVFLQEYGEAFNRERFIKRLCGTTYADLQNEARRQRRSSSDIAQALAIVKMYNRGGGRGTVEPRLLTMKD